MGGKRKALQSQGELTQSVPHPWPVWLAFLFYFALYLLNARTLSLALSPHSSPGAGLLVKPKLAVETKLVVAIPTAAPLSSLLCSYHPLSLSYGILGQFLA